MMHARLKTTVRLVFYVFLILQCARVSHSAEKAFAMPAIGAKAPLISEISSQEHIRQCSIK